ncbi:MAG: hypothetical protein R3Y56_05960 [Akkermansia sp.]
MELFIDTSSSPPALYTSYTSSDSLVTISKVSLNALQLKRGDRLAMTVTVLDSTTARSLKFGARAKSDLAAGLLVYAETEDYTISGSDTVFNLVVTIHTDELTDILGIGTDKELASIVSLAEFSWVEGASYRVSESVTTTLYNDIIRDGSIEIPESSGVVASTTWVNTLLEESLYTDEEFTQFSGESESNATFTTMTLDARYIPAGKLQSLDILCRTGTSTGFSPSPAYLHIWQENAEGEFVKIGTSTNMITQVTGTVQAWEFDSLEIQSATTKVMVSADANDGWENQLNLGAQCFARDSDDSISNIYHSAGTTMTYIPEMNIRVLQEVERYTSQASFNSHAEDLSIHITEEERTAWNDKADSSSLATKVNSSTFTAHSGNDEIHITEEERTAWNAKADSSITSQLGNSFTPITNMEEIEDGGMYTLDVAGTEGYGVNYANMPARSVALVHITGITAGKFYEHELWSFMDAPYWGNSQYIAGLDVGTEVILRLTAIENGMHIVELLSTNININ